jgi:hypothetical protein
MVGRVDPSVIVPLTVNVIVSSFGLAGPQSSLAALSFAARIASRSVHAPSSTVSSASDVTT